MSDFVIKDSGKREEFSSGMVRDTSGDKTDYTLILDGPMFERWAVHLTKGAKKYAKRNWMKAAGEAELERFKESALRHFIEWFRGDRDEDHAAAVFFNINGAEYVLAKAETEVERLRLWITAHNVDEHGMTVAESYEHEPAPRTGEECAKAKTECPGGKHALGPGDYDCPRCGERSAS